MLLLCGPDFFTLMMMFALMLAWMLAPVLIISALVASIIIKIKAEHRRHELKGLSLDAGRRSR